MQDLTICENTAIEPAQDMNALFMDFIKWIDRSPNTTRAYIINFRQFAKYMQANGIKQPTRQDILSYRDYLTEKGCKPNTITAYLHSVRQFFAWTAANGYYPDISANIHAPKVDHTEHKRDCFTPQELLEIEKNIDKRAAEKTAEAGEAAKDKAGRVKRSNEQGLRIRAMYLLATNAALRTIEISRANVQDIETKNGQTFIYVFGKGRTEPDQKRPIAPEVAAAISEYLAARSDKPTGTSPLFVGTGNRSKGKRLAATTISTMLKREMQAAGFDSSRLSAHSLRHSCGTAVQELNHNISDTQEFMRHSSPATTQIYLHNDNEKRQADLAERLYNMIHGTGENEAADLDSILTRLTPAQLDTLTGIAAAMAAG